MSPMHYTELGLCHYPSGQWARPESKCPMDGNNNNNNNNRL